MELNVIKHIIDTGDTMAFSQLEGAEYFSDNDNANIYSFLFKLHTDKKTINFDNIRTEIENSQIKQKTSTYARLSEIEHKTLFYNEIMLEHLKKNFTKRIIIKLASKWNRINDGDYTIEAAIVDMKKAYDVLIYGIEKDKYIDYQENRTEITGLSKEKNKESHIWLSKPVLKEIFGDYLKPRFYILGGRPSMGKNMLADTLIVDLCKSHYGCYFSYDNTARETASKLMAIESEMFHRDIENGVLSDTEKMYLNKKTKNNIFIFDRRNTIYGIRAQVEKLKKNYDIRYIIIDYFTNIRVINPRDKLSEYENICYELKAMCNELGLTVILLSQSNDRKEKEHDTITFSLSELKWCGALEEEAYFVAGMEGVRGEGTRTVHRAKWKDGSVHRIPIKLDFRSMSVKELK